MICNKNRGKLITVDGANGAGKTTVIKKAIKELRKNNMSICFAREPTDTMLGKFIRKQSETLNGITLACMVAADRYDHIKRTIEPKLKEGKIVIVDRYILSSLVLQRMDGVDSDFIFKIHKNIIKPDLQIVITAEENIIRERLRTRNSKLTRFEKDNQTKKELKYLEEGIELLKEEKVEVQEIVNDSVKKSTKSLVEYINNLQEAFQ